MFKHGQKVECLHDYCIGEGKGLIPKDAIITVIDWTEDFQFFSTILNGKRVDGIHANNFKAVNENLQQTNQTDFYMVHRETSEVMKAKHRTIAEAIMEATRLAKSNPNVNFFVHHVIMKICGEVVVKAETLKGE